MDTEVLLFEVDDKRFGVRSAKVKEVVRAVKLSPLPRRSATLDGLLNLRGTVVPVVDIRALLGLATRPIRYTDHLIIVESEQRLLALRVDRATALVKLAAAELQAAQTILQGTPLVDAVGKAGDGIVHVLNIEQFAAQQDVATAIDSASRESSP